MATQLQHGFFNGEILPLADIRLSPLDRGFLFGEGVYEVIPVYAGAPLGLDRHLARLKRSLAQIALPCPLSDAALVAMVADLIRANGGGDLSIYLHFTRGVSRSVRNHVYPEQAEPTVFGMCQTLDPREPGVARDGVAAVTLPDLRWARCDIKATSLLANTMAREHARAEGAAEAILTRDDYVTEGAASSVFAITDGVVTQPPPDPAILPGTTAAFVAALLDDASIEWRYADLPVDALRRADEVWLASSTRELLPVTTLDNAPVGTGRPGPLWQRVDALYQDAKTQLEPLS
ncbi:MAG: aminotransferase class IV [Pseudomonadota bacterium]